MITEFDAYCESDLPDIRGEIESERSMLLNLVGMLLGILTALGWLENWSVVSVFQGLLTATTWVLMPSQRTVMDKVDQSMTAEDKIIESETKIIAGLDSYQVRMLQAVQGVHTVSFQVSGVYGDAKARIHLQTLNMDLIQAAERNEKETDIAIKSRERARLEKIQIEKGRTMVANKEGPELLMGMAAAYENAKARASQATESTEEEADGGIWSSCPSCQVM